MATPVARTDMYGQKRFGLRCPRWLAQKRTPHRGYMHLDNGFERLHCVCTSEVSQLGRKPIEGMSQVHAGNSLAGNP